MNKVTLIGRLVRDPELKFTPGQGTAVATATLAVDRRMPNKDGQREADFTSIVVWGKIAENLYNYMSKGKMIAVSGRIQARSYDAKDGTKRYVTEVVGEEVQFLDKSNNTGASQENPSTSGGSDNSSDFGADMTPIDDGDIPFN